MRGRLAYLRRLYAGLKLQVNETKSAVASAFGRNEWLRHRLRAIQLKHWKRGGTIYRELKTRGATHNVAKQVAVNGCRWWRNSAKLHNSVLTIAWFDQLGLPRLL